MVPVEPVSLSIAIATLFTACIECFEYFKAAKEFEQHFEVLLVKLEYQQERLLVWGDLAGICNEKRHDETPIPESEHKRQDLTKRCLDSIHRLFKDTDNLKTKYGLRAYTPAIDTAVHSGISSNALKRFRLRLGRQNQAPSVLEKTRWAIHDETKFQKLVQDIRDLIDGLMTRVPVPPELQEQKVQDDIASMVDDIQSLHLFQEACKDDYPEWWNAASAAIDASEIATQDNRLADERLEGYGPTIQIDRRIRVDNHPELRTYFGGQLDQEVHVGINQKWFFILTESCRAQDSETPCDQTNLGTMSFSQKHSFITPGSVRTRSAPGYRIAQHIDPVNFTRTGFTHADLDKHIQDRNAIKADAIANNESEPEDDDRYHVRVYIYCPPCACQIATALDICRYRNKNDFVDFFIRIDHRQKTCCSASFSSVEGLISVIDYIKEREKNNEFMENREVVRLGAIDREWIERNIGDHIEEDHLATLSPASQLARIAKEEPTCAAVVILGEVDYSIPLMGVPPFRPLDSGTLPRETHIFRNEIRKQKPGKWQWDRVFMGTYTSSDPLPPKRPAPIRSDTIQMPESTQRGSKRPRSSISDGEGS